MRMTANSVLAALTLSLGTLTAACLDRCETTLIAADTLSRALRQPTSRSSTRRRATHSSFEKTRIDTRHRLTLGPGAAATCGPFYPDQSPLSYFVINPGRGGSGKALRLVYLLGAERLLWKTNPEDNHNWYAPATHRSRAVLVPHLQERRAGGKSGLRQHGRGDEVGGVLARGDVGSDAVWTDGGRPDDGPYGVCTVGAANRS